MVPPGARFFRLIQMMSGPCTTLPKTDPTDIIKALAPDGSPVVESVTGTNRRARRKNEPVITTTADMGIVGVDPAAFNSGCGRCIGFCIDCHYRCKAGNGDRPT